MQSTMMDIPLSLGRLFTYGRSTHAKAKVFTATPQGVRESTFAEVGARAERLAHALRSLGVTGDQRVATFMWNNQEHFEAYMAIPAMGAVLHPLNIRLPPADIVYIANAAEDHVVLVDASLVPLFASFASQLSTVKTIVVVGPIDAAQRDALGGSGKALVDYDDMLSKAPSTSFPWPEVAERDACALAFTSGTTGHPKGVAYSHRSAYLHSMQLCMTDGPNLGPADRVLTVVPMFHVSAWGIPWAALMVGFDLVLPDRFLSPEHLARIIEATRPTFAGAVPTLWTGLLHHADAHKTDLGSLRAVLVGGSACPPSLMEAYEKRHGVPVLHAWGMTETSPLGSVALPPPRLSKEEQWPYRLTQGRLVAGVEGRLLGDGGKDVPHDGKSVGELLVRGPWVTGRYIPENDPEKFHEGWLRTGDVGTLSPDGYLTLTDRAKDVIKSGGEWISSVDLENRLMAHPSVLEACVIGVPDEKWGERPVACIVFRDTSTPDYRPLRDHLEAQLPKWQVPELWSTLSAVPKTSVGKFDKKSLRAAHTQGALVLTRLEHV